MLPSYANCSDAELMARLWLQNPMITDSIAWSLLVPTLSGIWRPAFENLVSDSTEAAAAVACLFVVLPFLWDDFFNRQVSQSHSCLVLLSSTRSTAALRCSSDFFDCRPHDIYTILWVHKFQHRPELGWLYMYVTLFAVYQYYDISILYTYIHMLFMLPCNMLRHYVI